MSDLIERLKHTLKHHDPEDQYCLILECDVRDIVTALSPVLPDEAEDTVHMLRNEIESQQKTIEMYRGRHKGYKQRIDKLTAPVLPEDVKEVLADLDDAKTEFFNLGSKGYAADIRSGMNLIERLYRDKSRLEYLRAMDERIRLKQYQRIDELEKEKENLLESALCILMPNCTKHTGDMTPPLSEFLDKFAGRCAVCDRQRIDELEAALKKAASWLSLRTPVTVRDQIEASWKGEEHEEKLEGKP